MVSLAGHSAGDEWRRRLDRPVAVGGVDVGVAEPRGLDPDDDLALTGDRLGNLLDDERPCEVLDDRGPHRLRRRPWTRPLLRNAGHRSLLRPVLASVPEAPRTDIGLTTDPMRSITDSGPGVGYERRHGQYSEPTMVNPLGASDTPYA